MKTLEVLDPVKNEYTDEFVCEIETMWNDADDYETVEVPITLDRVDKLEEVLDSMRRTQIENYHKVPGATDFFGEVDLTYGPGFMDEWPRDYDCDLNYKYQRHEYFWYDANGVKHHAKLVDQ